MPRFFRSIYPTRMVNEPFHDTSFNNPTYRVLLLKIEVYMPSKRNKSYHNGIESNFRANGFWHEIPPRLYQRRLRAQRECTHCRLSFCELLLHRTIFSGHVIVWFWAAPFEESLVGEWRIARWKLIKYVYVGKRNQSKNNSVEHYYIWGNILCH